MIKNITPRSESVSNITSYGMKCILNEIVKSPCQPFGIAELKDKYSLNRNDIINARRQIKKINKTNGSIRYIEPARTHIVFIDDSIVDENEIDSILSSCAAISHAEKKNMKLAAILRKKLSHLIYKLSLQENQELQ